MCCLVTSVFSKRIVPQPCSAESPKHPETTALLLVQAPREQTSVWESCWMVSSRAPLWVKQKDFRVGEEILPNLFSLLIISTTTTLISIIILIIIWSGRRAGYLLNEKYMGKNRNSGERWLNSLSQKCTSLCVIGEFEGLGPQHTVPASACSLLSDTLHSSTLNLISCQKDSWFPTSVLPTPPPITGSFISPLFQPPRRLT